MGHDNNKYNTYYDRQPFLKWAERGNIGFYFYRGLYEGLEEKLLSQDKDLEEEILKRSKYLLEKRKVETIKDERWIDRYFKDISHFCLVTTYPGLLIGSGYSHGIKSQGDFKLGFYFDYTTGLPVIPGSTIKGVLRSAFGASHNKNERFRQEKQNYIWATLEEIAGQQWDSKIKSQVGNSQFVAMLEKDIFEGIGSDGKVKPLADRDIFFDAYPVPGTKNNEQNLFYDDYVTPHVRDKIDIKNGTYEVEDASALQNPKPIRFLKVAPGVRFKFSFLLHDSVISTGPNKEEELKITREMKVELFRRIILDLGLGAKTNLGYGTFTEG